MSPKTSRMALASFYSIVPWYVVLLGGCIILAIRLPVIRNIPAPGAGLEMMPVIIALFFGWIPFAILGLLLGIIALVRIRRARGEVTGRWAAIWGISLSFMSPVLGFGLPILLTIIYR